MYEVAALQEAYSGSLIAGKGRELNSIKTIMGQTKFAVEDWTRVRFGAGTPWRRCWCVISPPHEKDVQKQQKQAKKASAYGKPVAVIKGNIKFYDTRKITKKTRPVATIQDAYSCYAVYPQSRALIEQSTLIKIEGVITIHTNPEITTEGFIFVMPETHAMVSGFEMMLRFLFPVYDVFHMYGRPNRLIADTLDSRGLMFALPQEKRYGYLEVFDVVTLINKEESRRWSDREWRKQLKTLTSERVSKIREDGGGSVRGRTQSQNAQKHRNSLPSHPEGLRWQDGNSMRSTLSLQQPETGFAPPNRTDSAPPGDASSFSSGRQKAPHSRSVSETVGTMSPRRRALETAAGHYTPTRQSMEQSRSRMSIEEAPENPPPPPSHAVPVLPGHSGPQRMNSDTVSQASSDSDQVYHPTPQPPPLDTSYGGSMSPNGPASPVAHPPSFAHQAGSKPATRPADRPEMRRLNSRLSNTTLDQLAAANNPRDPTRISEEGAPQGYPNGMGDRYSEDRGR